MTSIPKIELYFPGTTDPSQRGTAPGHAHSIIVGSRTGGTLVESLFARSPSAGRRCWGKDGGKTR